MLRERLKVQREVWSEHSDTFHSMVDLGNILDAEAKYPETLALKQSALDVQHRTLGPDHRDTLTMFGLTNTLEFVGRYVEAEIVQRGLLDADRPSSVQKSSIGWEQCPISRSFSASFAHRKNAQACKTRG
jgi:hypothetical protein